MLELPHTDVASPLQNERRLVERVLRYWTKAAAGKRFPRLNEIDAWMVGDDWANCLVMAVQSPVELSQLCRRWGEPRGCALRQGHAGGSAPFPSATGPVGTPVSDRRG